MSSLFFRCSLLLRSPAHSIRIVLLICTVSMFRFVPKYFEKDIESGMPRLTEEGRRVVEEELREGLSVPAPAPTPSTPSKPPLSATSTETAVPSVAAAV